MQEQLLSSAESVNLVKNAWEEKYIIELFTWLALRLGKLVFGWGVTEGLKRRDRKNLQTPLETAEVIASCVLWMGEI